MDTHGKVLGVDNMFDGYCVAVKWKEERADFVYEGVAGAMISSTKEGEIS